MQITPGYWKQLNGDKAEILAIRRGFAYGIYGDGDPFAWIEQLGLPSTSMTLLMPNWFDKYQLIAPWEDDDDLDIKQAGKVTRIRKGV